MSEWWELTGSVECDEVWSVKSDLIVNSWCHFYLCPISFLLWGMYVAIHVFQIKEIFKIAWLIDGSVKNASMYVLTLTQTN